MILTSCIVAATTQAHAGVIYHAFDTPFRSVVDQLPEIASAGFTWVQVSPPQKSHGGDAWYFRYQPIDHTRIEGPLGSGDDLRALIQAAHARHLKVIVDVVLNHMADEGDLASTLAYPRFSAHDFHPRACIDYGDRSSVMRGWLGGSCNLPDLDTSSPYVRSEARSYLALLLGLGADGFRFDAAKHLEPEFFRDILTALPPDTFVYGENIPDDAENSTEFAPYTDLGHFSIEDFFLVRTMQQAFAPGGDLRTLADPQLVAKRRALPGIVAVTFARNHDTAKRTVQGYTFGDRRDVLLADAFILSREDGFPLIYGGDPRPPEGSEPADSSTSDASERIVRAAVAFHEQMMGKSQSFVDGGAIADDADNPNTLFLRRGSTGLAVINKAGELFDARVARMPGMDLGCYRELQYGFLVSIDRGGDGNVYVSRWGTPARGGLSIGPRDALFLVKTSSAPCGQ